MVEPRASLAISSQAPPQPAKAPEGYAPEEVLLTLEDFYDCQDRACQELLRRLTSPIHWRIVVDSSATFGTRPGYRHHLVEDLKELLKAIPFDAEDSLTIDSFDANYHDSEKAVNGRETCIFSRPLTTIAAGSTGALSTCLQALLPACLPTLTGDPPCAFTDFRRTLQAIQAGAGAERDFYLFLTDGVNEPLSPRPKQQQPLESLCRRHVDLFTATSTFAPLTSSFVKETSFAYAQGPLLERGLFFFLIPSPPAGSTQNLCSEVTKDWLRGAKQLAERFAGSSRPLVFQHVLGDSYPKLESQLRAAVRRLPEILPCFNLQPLAPPQATKNSNRPPEARPIRYSAATRCLSTDPRRLILTLPPAQTRANEIPIPLELQFLANSRTQDARVRITARPVKYKEPETRVVPDEPLETTATDMTWNRKPLPIELPKKGNRLGAVRLPAEMRFSLVRNGVPEPFLQLEIRDSNLWDLVLDIVREAGFTPLCIAFVAFAASLFFTILLYKCDFVVQLGLRSGDSGEYRPAAARRVRFNGLRARIDLATGLIREVLRDRPPDPPLDFDGCYWIDVFFIALQPHIVLWSNGDKPRLREGESKVKANKTHFCLLRPKSLWLREMQPTLRSAFECRRFWAQDIAIDLNNNKRHWLKLEYDPRPRVSILSSFIAGSLWCAALALWASWRERVPDEWTLWQSRFTLTGLLVAGTLIWICLRLGWRRFSHHLRDTRLLSVFRYLWMVERFAGIALAAWCLAGFISLFYFTTATTLVAWALITLALIALVGFIADARLPNKIQEGKGFTHLYWLESLLAIWGKVNI